MKEAHREQPVRVIRSALADSVAALGPFFAFATHDHDAPPADPWRPMGELVRDPAVLRDRVAAVRGRLAAAGGRDPREIEVRVAASVTHLGLVARLVSPALALAALHGAAAPLALDCLRWQPLTAGTFPLSLPAPPWPLPRPAGGDPVTATADALLDGPLGELAAATTCLGVPPRVLWGNVASAANGAAAAAAATAPPADAARIRQAAAVLLARPRLHDSHTGAPGGGRFRRRSCCLIYRAAPGARGAVCGDCVLADRR